MLTLALYRGGTLVQNVAVDGRNLRIGRLPENDLVLPDDGKAISKVHAELRMEKGGYFIHDLGSTNGTWLDGERITRAALAVGREVVIGPYRLVLSDDGANGLTPPSIAEQPEEAEQPQEYHSRKAEISSGTNSEAVAEPRRYSGPAIGWLGRRPKPLIFGGTAAIMVLVVGVAIWQLWPAQTQEATPAPEQTIQLPPPEAPPPAIDPHGTHIAEATSIIEGAERAVDEGAFSGAIADFKRSVSEHLERVLQVDPNHGEAVALQKRAADGISRAQAADLQAQAKRQRNPKGPTQDEVFKQKQAIYPLQKRADESIEEWSKRNELALSDNQAGLAQLQNGNCLEAKKIFSELSKREPSLVDAPRRLQEATDSCNARGQAAIAQGDQKEASGDWLGAASDFATAKRYEHPDADKRIADNFNQRKTLATTASRDARIYANRGLYLEAIKQYEEVRRLLPASDKDHQLAAAQIEELKRKQSMELV